MTETMRSRTDTAGLECLARAARRLRRRAILSLGVAWIAVAGGAVLLLSWLPAPWREGRGSALPLAIALLLAGGGLAAARLATRFARGLEPERLAGEADEAGGLGAGDVRAALELRDGPGRGSGELAALHRARVSRRLAGLEPDRLFPRSAARWRRRTIRAGLSSLLALMALGISGLARPMPTRSALAALAAPWRIAFPAPLPRLRLGLEGPVGRGEPARVVIEAVGRSDVTLVHRSAGEVPGRTTVALAADGRARARTGAISGPTRLWVEDEHGATSDTLLVRPLEPLLVQDLRVHLDYPDYLGRESESFRGQLPPLVVPEGTRIALTGETNLPLSDARLVPAGTEPDSADPDDAARTSPPVALRIQGTRFEGDFRPAATGRWNWSLAASGARGAPILPEPLIVVVVPDERPSIALLFPAPDTLLGSDRIMPLVVEAEDDLGLRQVIVASWRSGLGGERGETREVLAPAPGGSRRAVFRHLLDRSDDELLPGDTVFYRFEARDGHPLHGPAVSPVYLLRVPAFAEARERRAERMAELSDAAARVEEALAALNEAADDAAARVERDAEAPGEASFATTEEARSVLEDAGGVEEELTALDEEMQALRDDLADSAVRDPELAAQLERLAERYRDLAEAGLAGRMEELAEALRALDPDAVRTALERLAEDSERLREQLNRTLGTLERAALEQALEAAAAKTENLAAEQRALAGENDADRERWRADQEALAERAEALARGLDSLESRLGDGGRAEASDSAGVAGERTEEAAARMREASSGRTGEAGGAEEGERARSAASAAAEAMQQASEALEAARQGLSREGREGAAETLGRARSEALSLAQEEARLAASTRADESIDPETWRARQGAVRQGLGNLVERLARAGNEAAMLDRETGAAAGEAAARMDRLLERLAEDGARRLPSRAETEGVQDALNVLAARLLAGEQAARAGQQQAAGQPAAEQMASLAEQQQGVTQETGSLLMPGPRPGGEETLREEIARQQQEIADGLRDLDDPEGELLARPEELAREADALARQLAESGPSQETLERQRRLFRRMLDAGRTLEDDDIDEKRRESVTGRAVPREIPLPDPDLPGGRRFPLPAEAALRDLPLFYRALILDYFDRLNRPSPSAPAGGGGNARTGARGAGSGGSRRAGG